MIDLEYPGLRTGPFTQGAQLTPTFIGLQAPDHSLEPWANPQPTVPLCPTCGFVQNVLYGQLEPKEHVILDRAILYTDPAPETGEAIEIEISILEIASSRPGKEMWRSASCMLERAIALAWGEPDKARRRSFTSN